MDVNSPTQTFNLCKRETGANKEIFFSENDLNDWTTSQQGKPRNCDPGNPRPYTSTSQLNRFMTFFHCRLVFNSPYHKFLLPITPFDLACTVIPTTDFRNFRLFCSNKFLEQERLSNDIDFYVTVIIPRIVKEIAVISSVSKSRIVSTNGPWAKLFQAKKSATDRIREGH